MSLSADQIKEDLTEFLGSKGWACKYAKWTDKTSYVETCFGNVRFEMGIFDIGSITLSVVKNDIEPDDTTVPYCSFYFKDYQYKTKMDFSNLKKNLDQDEVLKLEELLNDIAFFLKPNSLKLILGYL